MEISYAPYSFTKLSQRLTWSICEGHVRRSAYTANALYIKRSERASRVVASQPSKSLPFTYKDKKTGANTSTPMTVETDTYTTAFRI